VRFSNTITNRFNPMTSLTWANVITSCIIIIVLALIETCKRDGPIEEHVQSYSKQIVTNQTNYQKVVYVQSRIFFVKGAYSHIFFSKCPMPPLYLCCYVYCTAYFSKRRHS